MKNLRKKLLVSIFTLMIAVVAVATTTYAWFTLGTSTTVSNIELGAKGDEGFSIRVISINGTYETNKNYASELDLTSKISNFKLRPLYMKEKGKLYSLTGVNTEETKKGEPVYSAEIANTTKEFLEIEFGFYSNTSGLNIYVQDIVSATKEPTYNFTSPITLDGPAGVDQVPAGSPITKARLANAIRVAIMPAASFDNGITSAATSYTSQTYKLFNSDIYCDNAEGHSYGTWYDRMTGGETDGNAPAIQKGALQYFNALRVNKLTKGIPAEYTYDYADDAALSNTPIVTLSTSAVNGAYYGAIKVLVWLEGWDGDCFDAVQNDFLKLTFKFKTKE